MENYSNNDSRRALTEVVTQFMTDYLPNDPVRAVMMINELKNLATILEQALRLKEYTFEYSDNVVSKAVVRRRRYANRLDRELEKIYQEEAANPQPVDEMAQLEEDMNLVVTESIIEPMLNDEPPVPVVSEETLVTDMEVTPEVAMEVATEETVEETVEVVPNMAVSDIVLLDEEPEPAETLEVVVPNGMTTQEFQRMINFSLTGPST